MGFYAAVWPLVNRPLADSRIGLPTSWIIPDNSDNKDKPLAPQGTLARTWKARGPTWSDVFQTIEGGLGYWAGNHFRYGPPKFSMNATPQCYVYEIGSPAATTSPVATTVLHRPAGKHYAETQTTIVEYLDTTPMVPTFWFRLAGGRCVIRP